MSTEVQAAAGRLGAIKRRRPNDTPAIDDARRDLQAARLEDHIRRVVDEAPPLTSAQRDKLATLLRGTAPVARDLRRSRAVDERIADGGVA